MKKFLFGILGLLFAVPAVADTLPAGYTELEYIESTGTQWIDTGFVSSREAKFGIKFRDTLFQTDKGFFGSSSWVNSLTFYIKSGIPDIRYCLNNTAFSLDTTDATHSGELICSSAGVVGTLDGQEVSFPQITDSNSGSGNIYLFSGGRNRGGLKAKIDWFKIWDSSGTLVRNFVPAKNASGVVGMYDTVEGRFYENQGTGTFAAGPDVVLNPCRNLFDSSAFNTDVGQNVTWLHYRIPNGTYTMSTNFPPQAGQQAYTSVWVVAGNVTSGIDSATNGVSLGNPKTITVTDGWYSVAYRSGIPAIPQNPKDYNWQLEQGSIATEYVPFCANAIKIATTAYNAARFSPVVTELNDTIATIRSVVTNTINQTAAIADLQATKQTRPDETCPAGKKCLLVEDDTGQPHWFEIIESPEVQ